MNFLRPKQPSEYFLIAANILPLVGVFFWDWQVFDILIVFWLENVIIGFFNIVKMTTWIIYRRIYIAFFIVIFFILHYGTFTLGHGIGIFAFFGGVQPGDTLSFAFLKNRLDLFSWDMLIVLASLFASHTFSFFNHFLVKREIDRTNVLRLMGAPYGRVVMMHVTILIGGSAAMILGEPLWALALLVLLKIIADLRAHRKSHTETVSAIQAQAELQKILKKQPVSKA